MEESKRTYDKSIFIMVNIIIWAISGNIQMQPYSLNVNGVLVGTLLCVFSGLMSYFSASILLKKGSQYKTTEYVDVIEQSLGYPTAKVTQVIISLGYCVSQVFGIVYFLDFFKKSLTCLGYKEVLQTITLDKQYLIVFLILLPLYTHKRVSNMDFIFYGIFVCFCLIVFILISRSIYLIVLKGVR